MIIEQRKVLSTCHIPSVAQHSIGLINVQSRRRDTDDPLHFYVRSLSGKVYVLRMINSASEVNVLLKRVPIHGFQLMITNITSDQFDECLSSKIYKLGSSLPFLSPPVRTITEQYPGFMYDDILKAELNFIDTFQHLNIRNRILIVTGSINPVLVPTEDTRDEFLLMDTILCPSTAQNPARYALRVQRTAFTLIVNDQNCSLTEYEAFTRANNLNIHSGFINHNFTKWGNISFSQFNGQDARLVFVPEKEIFVAIYTLPIFVAN